ncbi:Pentatricopeptide repeat-containing protein [Nymphaea thermarum]|nr:Pentatricopeptide repeat-containing protein [Nymphaea thermarum]
MSIIFESVAGPPPPPTIFRPPSAHLPPKPQSVAGPPPPPTICRPPFPQIPVSVLYDRSTLLFQTETAPRIICSHCHTAAASCCSSFSLPLRCHASLITSGLAESLHLQTKLVAMYSLLGSFDDGLIVFDRIKNPDSFSWKVLIQGSARNQLFSDVLWAYGCMRRSSQDHDNAVFSMALKACVQLRFLDEGKQIHCDIAKVGGFDDIVAVGLINLYSECGDIRDAQKMFVEMPKRNVVAWTSIIVGYMHKGLLSETLKLFNQMLREVKPNQFTMASLLSACCQLDFLQQGKWVHSYLIKTGLYLNSFVATALMDLYVKCGSISDATLIFEQLPYADVVSWTSMIVGYTQRGLSIEALKIFLRMRRTGLLPNEVTMASVLSTFAQRGSRVEGQSIHAFVILLGMDGVCEVNNSLIDMYAKCHMVTDAFCVFERILHKDLISWNTMINGFSQNRLGVEALCLFHRMRLTQVSPDAVTCVGVLSACSSLGALEMGTSLHGYAVKVGILSNVYVGTALLNLYAKCGSAGMAKKVFDEMDEKNITTWSAMVGGYGMHGDAKNSLTLLQDMLQKGVQPNDVIYTSILSACSHAGMVSEGCRHFDDMCNGNYTLPSMKHYACMIDMLGRAGRLDEAVEFIRKMPLEPNAGIWGALFHACKIHSTIELGEKAANILLDLQPETGYYVLMSNMYAEAGRWEDAATIRALMKERRMKKSPGSSILDTRNFVASQETL